MNSLEAGGRQDLCLMFSSSRVGAAGRRSPRAQHLRDIRNLSNEAKYSVRRFLINKR